MATARRSEFSVPTVLMWCTVPRGTQTMSSLRASTTMPPVSSHVNSPARTTHHSSKSACQCGRLPPPGRLAISVTSWRSSWMTRRDHGGGPILATRSATRVRSVLGPSGLAARGGVGPVAKCGMVMVVIGTLSPREWIGTELKLDDLARRPLAAFDVEGCSGGVGGPEPLAFPAGIRVVDAAVHPLGVEAHGVGDAKDDELSVHEGEEPLIGVPGADRHVPAQAEGVELIDPGVVARLGAARIRHVRKLWPRVRIERPALGTVLSRRLGSVEGPLALAPVEAREMPAGKRRPHDAVPVDVHAARPVSWERRLENFRESSRRGIRARVEADDVPREAEHRAPHGAVVRVHADSVEGRHDPLVLGRIDRLVGLDVLVALAVAVGVEDERRPALGFLLVTGLVEHLAIQPADDAAGGPAGARPQRVV